MLSYESSQNCLTVGMISSKNPAGSLSGAMIGTTLVLSANVSAMVLIIAFVRATASFSVCQAGCSSLRPELSKPF